MLNAEEIRDLMRINEEIGGYFRLQHGTPLFPEWATKHNLAGHSVNYSPRRLPHRGGVGWTTTQVCIRRKALILLLWPHTARDKGSFCGELFIVLPPSGSVSIQLEWDRCVLKPSWLAQVVNVTQVDGPWWDDLRVVITELIAAADDLLHAREEYAAVRARQRQREEERKSNVVEQLRRNYRNH